MENNHNLYMSKNVINKKYKVWWLYLLEAAAGCDELSRILKEQGKYELATHYSAVASELEWSARDVFHRGDMKTTHEFWDQYCAQKDVPSCTCLKPMRTDFPRNPAESVVMKRIVDKQLRKAKKISKMELDDVLY